MEKFDARAGAMGNGDRQRRRRGGVCEGAAGFRGRRETNASAARRAAGDCELHAAVGEIDGNGGEGGASGVLARRGA